MLREVSLRIQDSFRASGDANTITEYMMTRLEAIVNPTPELKIRAISAQPMKALAEAMVSAIREMNSSIKETQNQVSSLTTAVESGYVQCPTCSGSGDIEEGAIQRDEESVGAYTQYKTCPACNGNKVLPISSDFRSNCLAALDGLRTIGRRTDETTP